MPDLDWISVNESLPEPGVIVHARFRVGHNLDSWRSELMVFTGDRFAHTWGTNASTYSPVVEWRPWSFDDFDSRISWNGMGSTSVDRDAFRAFFEEHHDPKTSPYDTWHRYCREHGICSGCHSRGGPSHNGSSRCRSGSIASGGERSHCTCDTCF